VNGVHAVRPSRRFDHIWLRHALATRCLHRHRAPLRANVLDGLDPDAQQDSGAVGNANDRIPAPDCATVRFAESVI
jgi:hypothetical protein